MKDRLMLFWRLQLTGWLAYSISMIPSRLVIYSSIDMVLLVMLVKDGFGFVATLGLRELYRRTPLRLLSPIGVAPWLVGFSIVLGSMDMMLGYWFFHKVGIRELMVEKQTYIWFGIWARSALYAVWSLLYFAIKFNVASRARHRAWVKAEARRRDAEVLMLRSQMNPHFLFNAFNSMVARAEGNQALLGMIEHLTTYLRYSLTFRQGILVPLEAELNALQSYVELEKIRFGSSLQVEMEVEEAACKVMVPGIFVQPLVENAIKYGRATCKQPPLKVKISCRLTDQGLCLEVRNTGHWVEPHQSDPLYPSGAGLSILRQSLELYYENAHEFELGGKDGEVVARLLLRGTPGFVPDRPLLEDATFAPEFRMRGNGRRFFRILEKTLSPNHSLP